MQLTPGKLTLTQLIEFYFGDEQVSLDDSSWKDIAKSRAVVDQLIERGDTVYGMNTGFGLLATKKISNDDLAQLQVNLVRSHSAGTGPAMNATVVRLIMLLKLASISRGYSGVRRELVEGLLDCLNKKLYPYIPERGSVGASGDLAPLAHMSLALIGEGEFLDGSDTIAAKDCLKKNGLQPIQLQAKEGLALLNGTQASTALALSALFNAQRSFRAAIIAGALSVDAAKGSDTPFDARIHAIRNHETQIQCAKLYRDLLDGSKIRESHRECTRVQDPYSLRCQPQVMGACLESLRHAQSVLIKEANAVSDNPLVFADDVSMLSGGNFHAEPVAIAADQIASALAEVGALSERRVALLIDQHLSNLPAFLTKKGGLNSGFMIPQVTAAALVSENKHLATPCSTDSLPTSANQEDHVSMATYAARRLTQMVENLNSILAIELLAACQGIDFHAPLQTSSRLVIAHHYVRECARHYDDDRTFHQEIEDVSRLVGGNHFDAALQCDELFANTL